MQHEEALAVAPAAASRLLHPLYAKAALHIQQPLEFKGSFLHDIFKNKGAADLCESWRGVHIESHLGKLHHRDHRGSFVRFRLVLCSRTTVTTRTAAVLHGNTR